MRTSPRCEIPAKRLFPPRGCFRSCAQKVVTTHFFVSRFEKVSPLAAPRVPPSRARMLTTERAAPLASRRRTAFVVMSFSLINFDALRASLVAVPRHRQRPFHDEPPRAPSPPRVRCAARRPSTTSTTCSTRRVSWPATRALPCPSRLACAARARASRERERRTSCPVHATPARMHACGRRRRRRRRRPRPISRCQAITLWRRRRRAPRRHTPLARQGRRVRRRSVGQAGVRGDARLLQR